MAKRISFVSVSLTALFFELIVNRTCFAQEAAELGYRPGALIVRFAPTAAGGPQTRAEKDALLSAVHGGVIKREFKRVPGLALVELPAGRTVNKAIADLHSARGILYVEPDYQIRLLATFPDDPRFAEQWALHYVEEISQEPNAHIHAPEAWDLRSSADDVIVAVIDTGVDYNHPDLSANMWVNQVELNGDPNTDDDGNGHIDDIYGWDFADNDNNPTDFNYHGTHVAGIVGGRCPIA